MGTRIFEVDFDVYGVYVDTATIQLDERVIDAVTDEWRSNFYNLHTPEEIAQHIAYNIVIHKWKLSDLDGWADMPDEYAKIMEWPNLDQWETTAKELV
jgi:hypothetical protein